MCCARGILHGSTINAFRARMEALAILWWCMRSPEINGEDLSSAAMTLFGGAERDNLIYTRLISPMKIWKGLGGAEQLIEEDLSEADR